MARGTLYRAFVESIHQRISADISIDALYVVGDRWRDIEAGRRAGCRTVWIDRNDEPPATGSACRVQTLLEAYEWIINDCR